IRYPFAVVRSGDNPTTARHLARFLSTPAAKAVLRRHRFTVK
ncbi:MAG: hypothetical protein JWN98_1914, partial [Abditibacteriota bacterium]|nr:hypothetical protein [Abditibacteriota bacterium]